MILFKYMIFILFLTIYTSSYALTGTFTHEEGIGKDGRPVSVRLTVFEEPCTNEEVLKHLHEKIQPWLIPFFMRSELVWGGEVYPSCYIVSDGHVFSIDNKGEPIVPMIPEEYFKNPKDKHI